VGLRSTASYAWTCSSAPPTVTLYGELCDRITAFEAERVDVVEGFVEFR